MAKKRPRVSLAQAIKPRSGDLRKLFSTEEDAEQASGMQLLAVRLDAIVPDPDQPRRTFPEDSLQELSDSIQQDGVIQPIEVTELDADHYMIVHGERRWKAAQLAGLETIPAVIRRYDYDTITRLVRQLVENIQREDLNDVDRAAGLLRMREFLQAELDVMIREGTLPDDSSPWSKTITWAKVGKRLGMSRQRIHQLIRLLDLPEAIKEDVRTGKLSERDTRVYQRFTPGPL
jgi:ParB family chromosome partitioning protein